MKQTLKIATVLGVLLAAYAGYVRGFAILAATFRPPSNPVAPPEEGVDSPTTLRAKALALQEFGANHWTTDPKATNLEFTDKNNRFYAGTYDRKQGGKVFEFRPFAVISVGSDGKLQSISGKAATLTFEEAVDVGKPTSKPMRVVHARVDGDVVIRDNKGTVDRGDDLEITGLTYLEYDEKDLQIRSKSRMHLRDRDLTADALGVRIALRPPAEGARPGGAGFDGARTIWLEKDVKINIGDVGKTGILPGSAPDGPAGAKTPMLLTSDGEARFDLPEPATPIKGKAPPPPAPTYARFVGNVRVLRGDETPDELLCDVLRLTLAPAPKGKAPTPAQAADEGDEGDPAAPPAAPGGPLTELKLVRAVADGHKVWLISDVQGAKISCQHLIHTKPGGGRADETYLSADAGQRLHVEKEDLVAEGPEKGKLLSVTAIEAADATIFQDPDSADPAKPAKMAKNDKPAQQGPGRIVARGPGWMETRPARDKPVERRATWEDSMVMETKSQDVEPYRLITLTGNPTMVSPVQGDLRARDLIKICMVPKAAPPSVAGAVEAKPAGVEADNSPASAMQGHQLKWMHAIGDVHLVSGTAPPAGAAVEVDGGAPTPGKKTMYATDQLFVRFEPEAEGAAAPAAPAAPAPAPAPEALAAAEPAPDAPAAEGPEPLAEVEPDMDVQADVVWARVVQAPGATPGATRGEVREVRLKGHATVHREPEHGKPLGTDMAADSIQVNNEGGPGHASIIAEGASSDPEDWARLVTEGSQIEGGHMEFDQNLDRVRVVGPGRLVQLADGTALGGPAPAPGAKKDAKRPMVITWSEMMVFNGQMVEADHPDRVGPAQARFYGDARAIMGDPASNVDHEEIESHDLLSANFDRPVSFTRPRRDPKAPPAEPEPKAQIVSLHGTKRVVAQAHKFDPKTRNWLQTQRIACEDLSYDRITGNYFVEGAPANAKSYVYLYEPADKPAVPATPGARPDAKAPAAALPTIGADAGAADRRIIRVAGPAVARRDTASGKAAKPKAKAAKGPEYIAAPRKPDPVQLTQILFDQRMEGRFVEAARTAEAPARAGRREARFYGGVEVLRGRVPNLDAVLDSDRIATTDRMDLTARNPDQDRPSLIVESQAPPAGSTAKARSLMDAAGDAIVRNQGSTIYGDFVRYDSQSNLATALCRAGNRVSVIRQDTPGQPLTASAGDAYRYNLTTGEGQVVHPDQMQLFESNQGYRPLFFSETPPPKVAKPKRLQPKLPSRSDKDRRGFMGH